MPVPAPEAKRHFDALAASLTSTIDGLRATEAHLRAERDRVRTQVQEAALGLAGAYVPALERPVLDRAARLTGFRGFTQRDPFAAMAHEQNTLTKTIARVRANGDYQAREQLVGPYGALTRAVAEAREMATPWEEDCRRYEELPGWQELLDAGYDTPAFAVGVFEARYWRLWAQGDAACEALGVGDFGDDVLPAWRKLHAERTRWRDEVARAEAKVKAVHDLVRQHDEAVARIPRLPELMLAQCRATLAEWLGRADVGLLDEWLKKEGEDRGVLMALRELAGLRAKVDILDELVAKGLGAVAGDLEEKRAKALRKSAKYARPKNWGLQVPDADLAPGIQDKLARLDAENERLRQQVDKMVRYDRYDRFVLDNDPELWWFEFTNSRPSRFSPGLREWYARHPGAGVRRDDSAVAVAVASAAGRTDAEGAGYLS